MSAPLLSVEDLSITLDFGAARFEAVKDVSFTIRRGETYGLVGESGCGKSITALAMIGLLKPPMRIGGGRIRFDGREIQALPADDMRKLRGARISMIFQEPMTALNPVSPVGRQIAEMFVLHEGASWAQARKRAVEALAPSRRWRASRCPRPSAARATIPISSRAACVSA